MDVKNRRSVVRKGRLGVNLIANVLGYAANIAIGIIIVPYLIGRLGVSAYGLVPLAAQITSYLMIVTWVLNVSIGRHLTVALEQSDGEKAGRIFNTSVLSAAGITVIGIPAALLFLRYSGFFVRVPAGMERDTTLLLAFTIGGFMVTQVFSPFAVSTLCRNRFDVRNAVDISSILIRFSFVVMMFNIAAPKVWHMGLGILAGSVFAGLGAVAAWRFLTPELKLRAGIFDWKIFREMAFTGGWLTVTHLGALLYVGIDLILVNRMLGPEVGGLFAVAVQWSVLLRGAAASLSTVFYPTFMYKYAAGEMDGLILYARRSVKIVGLGLALPIGFISGMSGPLLKVWVGPEFTHLAGLLTLLTIHLSVNLAVYPLFSLQLTLNRVKTPAIVTCAMGVGKALLAILLMSRLVGWGMYGVAIAGAVILTAKNLIFTPLYGAHILKTGKSTFYREMVPIVACTLGAAAASRYLAVVFDPGGWVSLIACGGVLAVLYGLLVFFALLSPEEREAVRRFLGMSDSGRTVSLKRAGVKEFLGRFRFVRMLPILREFISDFARFFKCSGTFRSSGDREAARALLSIESHCIEKALSLKETRAGFGVPKVLRLIASLDSYLRKYGPDSTSAGVLKALDAYVDFQEANGGADEAVRAGLTALKEPTPGFNSDGGALDVSREQLMPPPGFDFDAFAKSRYSIRNFAPGRIEPELISEAVRRAMKTPSVCNRQPWRVHAFLSDGERKRVLSHQVGNVGFGESAGAILVVTSPLADFFGAGERSEPFVDGGLFSMSLVYALHSLGLGSCCLNICSKNKQADSLRADCGIPGDEVLIMMIAVGHIPDRLKVAVSPRQSVENILRIR